MSRNFELMQRAGKLLEIELPRPVGAESSPSIALPIPPALSPALTSTLAPPSAEKWVAGRAGLTVEQIAREESQKLIQHIFLADAQEPPHMVVFAGIDHGNGCTRICAKAAETLQENFRGTICIVEANFRSPSMHHLFSVTNHCGLTDALLGEAPMKAYATPLRKSNIQLMTCGSLVVNSHVLLNSERLRVRFDELRNEFDYVVVDAPPLTRYSDAIALGRAADGLVLVLEANATRKEAAVRVTDHLRASQIRILGAVLNKRTLPIPEPLYRRL
jgi:capsular exopolysaccharide synthesis family protein